MKLTDTQINYFVDNRLKLKPGKRAEYLAQVDNLITGFKAKVDAHPSLGIKKFLKTGSLRKGTVLRPRVPIIPIDGPGDYGWQPSSRGEAPVRTSVTKQLEEVEESLEA